MSETSLREITAPDAPSDLQQLPAPTYVATTVEALNNRHQNHANRWYKKGADSDDPSGNYAFQRLRGNLFTPKIDLKFKLGCEEKLYAIGLCFARGLEKSLISRQIAVENAASEYPRGH
jgi:hypothetical protein